MVQRTHWAHLPNAKYIDWVLATRETHPEKWGMAWNAIYNSVWNAKYNAALESARRAALRTAGNTVSAVVRSNAMTAARQAAAGERWWEKTLDRVTAWEAIQPLIAYDDCGCMIESEVDEIKILTKIDDPRAILLLPACIVFNEMKKISI
jgi:hypothetical protein